MFLKKSNPLSITFKGANKFDIQNPVLRNILSQVNASKLSNKKVTWLLSEGENKKIQAWLNDALRDSNNARFNNDNDNNNLNFGNAPDEGDGGSGSGGGGPRRRKSKKPWRTKGPIMRHSPLPSKYENHSMAVPYVAVPPPQPEVLAQFLHLDLM